MLIFYCVFIVNFLNKNLVIKIVGWLRYRLLYGVFLYDLNCIYIFIILFNYICIDFIFVDEIMYDVLIVYSVEFDRDVIVVIDVIYLYLCY